jgi:hypothetical protein
VFDSEYEEPVVVPPVNEIVKPNTGGHKKTQEEINRGCIEKSKIYPIAYEVRRMYLDGASIDEIAYSFQGLTRNHIAGYVSRNNLKRPSVAQTGKPRFVRPVVPLEIKPEEIVNVPSTPQFIEPSKPKTIADICENIREEVVKAKELKTKRVDLAAEQRRIIASKILRIRAQERILAKKEDIVVVVKNFINEGKTISQSSDGCWYPIGEKPSRPAEQKFCARPQAAGSRFCAEHQEVACRPATRVR